MSGGFANSPLNLNAMLRDTNHWGEEEIIARASMLAETALLIWPRPTLDSVILAKYRTAQQPPAPNYTLAHFPQLKGKVLALFEVLSNRILNIHSSVFQVIPKTYIAFKTTTNFVDIIPQAKGLLLTLNMRFDEVHDPRGICKDLTNKGKLGNGDVQVSVERAEDIDYAMELIMQSFDKHSDDAGE